MSKQLKKSADKMIGGVCGGIADYMEVDSTIVRIGYVILAFITAVVPCVLIYIFLWIIMPHVE